MPDPRSSPQQTGAHADPALGVAAVARRLGVAPGTLRTWARRYGIGPSGHQAGAQRRYTGDDLARLVAMRRLMLQGVPAADAAQAALDDPAAATQPPPRRGLRRALSREPHAGTGRAAPPRRRTGGGAIVPLRDASPAARGLARAAMALDPVAVAELLTASLRRRGVVVTWQEMVLPVLAGVGERWRATGRGVEVEHLLSECVEDALRAVTRGLSRPVPAPPVLLAAPEPEAHALPLHAVAAALAERSVAVRTFGAGVPARALADAVARTGSAVVFLWSQGAAGPPDAVALHGMPSLRPRPVLVLGGPGWDGAVPPGPVRRVGDLPGALAAVLEALGLPTT